MCPSSQITLNLVEAQWSSGLVYAPFSTAQVSEVTGIASKGHASCVELAATVVQLTARQAMRIARSARNGSARFIRVRLFKTGCN